MDFSKSQFLITHCISCAKLLFSSFKKITLLDNDSNYTLGKMVSVIISCVNQKGYLRFGLCSDIKFKMSNLILSSASKVDRVREGLPVVSFCLSWWPPCTVQQDQR